MRTVATAWRTVGGCRTWLNIESGASPHSVSSYGVVWQVADHRAEFDHQVTTSLQTSA